MRSTTVSLFQDLKVLEEETICDESYHSIFDRLLEARLMELDKEYMEQMEKAYDKSGMSRWCA